MALKLRSEVPKEQTWNAESVYTDPQAWERDYRVVESHIAKLGAFEGKLTSAETLLDFLLYVDSLRSDCDKLRVYATLNYSVDMSDEAAATRYSQMIDLYGKLSEAMSFIKPELLALDPQEIEGWLEHPQLAEYQHSFEELQRTRKHTLSPELESILGSLPSLFSGVPLANQALANSELDFGSAADSEGAEHTISQSSIRGLLSSPDRILRQNTYELYADAHIKVQKTLGTLLSTGVKQTVFIAKTRHYDSPLHMALTQQNLPLDVFTSLIDTFKANLPTWHRYWRAKRKALGVDKLRPHDVHAPLVVQPKVNFQQSCDWLAQAMAPLGKLYVSTMMKGLSEQRWVDWSVNRGQTHGRVFDQGGGDTSLYFDELYA